MHRLFLVAFTIAVKFNEERSVSLYQYSALLEGVGTAQISAMERVFLAKLEYCLFVESDELR